MELKKGETIMTDAALHLPASTLHEAFSDRSGVPLDFFELYYRGKRLAGEAALASWGVEKDATIEVKMRGRGGMTPIGRGGSPGSGRRGQRSSCGSQARAAEEASVQEASAANLDALDNISTDPSNKDTVKDTVAPAPAAAAGSGAGGGLSAGTQLHHAFTDNTTLHDLLESKEHGGVGASAEKVLQMLKAHPEAASISKKGDLNLPLHIAARKFRGSGALDVVKALIHAYPDGPKQKGGVRSSTALTITHSRHPPPCNRALA